MTRDDLLAQVPDHPATGDCQDPECLICGVRDCPSGEPLHYHHDGCPSCFFDFQTPQEEDLEKLSQRPDVPTDL